MCMDCHLVTPLSRSDEDKEFFAFAGPFRLNGATPAEDAPDVKRILEIGVQRAATMTLQPGMVLQYEAYEARYFATARWYIIFADDNTFREATGGHNESFGPGDLDAFLARLTDSPFNPRSGLAPKADLRYSNI